ncbi:sulfide/dihydroorotate dehydrogenase-like FAD/NAD-binding protein [Clostridium ganghwense]|uniref:Sulfide/dihydroorotate dehydrogenase-like FAD/NAD-binding protein n=1 Tax=Clostridium ganghwense TaxID=312089 RepID=A0ABT4CL38_9CLOT|nr:sulfide/dihydroorotate dehydrogenase-like FAD/NAD-binding protein [Clostridium ganghwense]MCY6369757.1 sulfide/dihydroorotate dehydrogenase-like FAD/NAD-binding protein [Clostridium ganghwense]
MFKIIKKKLLVPNIYLMDIEAPRVANTAKPGQFVIVKMHEKGERVPLTICDYNKEKGTITIVFQAVGRSTEEMAKYKEGEYFEDFVGPLGKPSEFLNENIEELKNKKVLFISGGVGAAPVYPQVKWCHEHGIKADVIMGTRSKDLLILEDEMKSVADNVYVTTDDGSYGFKGLVTDKFKDLVDNEDKKYDYVVAIGPIIMMKFVSLATKPYEIKTIVSMNPLMVDGTGMCGACRVTVGDKTKFACVDGPEFDGHLVDFDEAMRRQAMYKTEEGREKIKIEEANKEKHHHHHGGCGCCGGEE